MSLFVTGTDTDVGKTVACAWLLRRLDAVYWKPIQSGLDGETDCEAVARYAGLDAARILKPRWELPEPLSPHEAAKRAGVAIQLSDFRLPETERPLVVEGAGGVMVPLNDQHMMRDLMMHLGLPVVVVARSGLGTINHTLLTLASLRDAGLEIAGLILNGAFSPHNLEAVETFGGVRVIAEIPLFGDDVGQKVGPASFDRVREHVSLDTLPGVAMRPSV